jgi:Glycosyl transferase family 11
MIIVRLEGGLGNQMFEYAMGRRLAVKHLSLLKLDISWFATQELRQYRLNYFNICEEFAKPIEVDAIVGNYSILKWLSLKIGRKLGIEQSSGDVDTEREILAIIYGHQYNLLQWWLARIKHKIGLHRSAKDLDRKGKYIRQKYYHFDPSLLDAPDSVYLDGFWQSEKYFVDIQDILRREFTLKNPQTAIFEQIASIIDERNSVSLHIRRGDIANNPETNLLHGTCSLEYYERAIGYIAKRIELPHFFIFSDDPDWVKENLKLSFPSTNVSCGELLPDYEELHLMSRCQNHIIANSSFSWWAAWLNPTPDKCVIAPKKWFGTLEYDHDTKDIIPTSWVRL